MSTIKTTIKNRRIELKAPDELPDGTEVLVDVTPVSPETVGIDESEWRDDPDALADWDAWLRTIESVELTPEEETANDRFEKEFHRFNVEAVRKQMEEGSSS